MVTIREPRQDELEGMYTLRWEVMRKPFGLPKGSERNKLDEISDFVIALDELSGKIVGTGTLVPREGFIEIIHLAVIDEFRGQGVGTSLMDYLHERAIEYGANTVLIIARANSEDFYKKLGYKAVGDYFLKPPTNTEHIRMVKEI